MTIFQERAVAYLKQVEEADLEIIMNRYRQEELRTVAEQCGAVVVDDKVQAMPSNSVMADAVSELIKEQERISKRIDDWLAVKKEVVDKIAQVENLNYREVLYRRYIMRMRRDKIAEKMHYSEEHIKTLRRNALDELGRLL